MSSLTNPFLVKNATLQLHELDSHRSTLGLPAGCDVLIIGAGYSGIATAYHLLDENPNPPSVLILEARQACFAATSRNGELDSPLSFFPSLSPHAKYLRKFQLGGHLKPDLYLSILKYSKKYGAENAAEFARFESANVLAVKELCREGEH
jgi:glycine/D-amino acid oxidase-like deaminating enzyme